ncbi:MAG TPA: gephyrin-like molybdotransferase Glp [Actinomycetota bacterium]
MADHFPPEQGRVDPPDMVPFEQARAEVLARLPPLPAREVGLGDALGCVLAADIHAGEHLPPFANSAMDGFAVRSADVQAASAQRPVALRLAGEVFAGSARLPRVPPGGAVRIMTGGSLPPGADAVVPVEQTKLAAGGDPGSGEVLVHVAVGQRAFVREAGEDVREGTLVLERGRVLDPAAIGMLASVGRRTVPVVPRPRVAVVSTGDELVDPGDPLGPGQIRDSNSWLLVAQARRAGAEAFRCGRLHDDPGALRKGFALAAAEGDLVLTSGGVSVGDRDYTRQVLAELGDVRGMRVAMQPGMPQAFGFAAGTPLYGLPGNPVSCFVVFELLVRPALRRLAGHPDDRLDHVRVPAVLGEPVRSPAGKVSFLRVRLEQEAGEGSPRAFLTGPQGSGVLSSCVAADGLAVIPAADRELAAGAVVEVVLLRDDPPSLVP